jgi:hypothetical protein
LTLPNQPTMPLSTARASAPPAVVSLLTAVRFHPALTSLNHPHLIVALQLSKLLPTRLANPSNPPFDEQIANRPCKTHSSTASAAPAASYKSPYRKCAGVMLHRLTRRFRAGALVDRGLRFCDCQQLAARITSCLPTIQELCSFTRQCGVSRVISGTRCDRQLALRQRPFQIVKSVIYQLLQ